MPWRVECDLMIGDVILILTVYWSFRMENRAIGLGNVREMYANKYALSRSYRRHSWFDPLTIYCICQSCSSILGCPLARSDGTLLQELIWSLFTCLSTSRFLLARLNFASKATVVAQAPVNSAFSETIVWIQAKFYWKLRIHHISKPFGSCCQKLYFSKFYHFFFFFFSFLALIVFTQQRYCHGAGVRRPSVNSGFSETPAWMQTKLYGKLPIHHISRSYFSSFFFSKFSVFKCLRFFFFRFR